MSRHSSLSDSVLGRRLRERREALGWSQERAGVAVGLEVSNARARISRYELGIHEPAMPVVRQMAEAFGVPLIYLYCEDDDLATLLLKLHELNAAERRKAVHQFVRMIDV